MSDDTPVRKALEYGQQPFKKPRGKPKSMWISMMIKQLANEHSLSLENAWAIAQDRNAWINWGYSKSTDQPTTDHLPQTTDHRSPTRNIFSGLFFFFFFFFLFVLDVPHLTNEHRTQDCIAS